MAKNRTNAITQGQSGKFGHFCFQKDGVMRRLPDVSNRSWSPLQIKHRQHLNSAKEYGRHAMSDPQLRAHYAVLLPLWKRRLRNKNVGIYQIAICDFSHPPRFAEVSLVNNGGPKGYCISFYAHDNFKVEGVAVALFMPDGKLIEEGTPDQPHGAKGFQYCIKNSGMLDAGLTARLRAWDVPGNITEKDFSCILKNNDLSLTPL